MVNGLPSSVVNLKSGAGSGLRTKRMTGWPSCCGAACAPAKAGARRRSSEVTGQRSAVRGGGGVLRVSRMASLIEEHIGWRTPSG